MRKILALSITALLIPILALAQSWQAASSLSVEKRFVLFSVLPTNKVLCTGGVNSDGISHSDCELFDPATGLWTKTASLQIGRILHSVTTLSDGRVAVMGGQISGSYDGGIPAQTAKVELFDPTTETWLDGGDLQVARQHQTASLLKDGRILVVGGLTGVTPVASAEIYDPASKTSTLVASMHQARYEHQATSLDDGRVMVTGGRIGGWDGTFFNEVEIYDPATDTWTVQDNMNQSRMRGLIIQFKDGSILSAAGRNSSTSTAPGSELFDLTTGHWISTDPMKQPCTWLATTLLPNEKYLATGGFIDANWNTSTSVLATPKCEWYDRLNKKWYYAPTLNLQRAEHAIAYLHQTSNTALPTDLVIVGGGITGNSAYTNTCEILDVTPSSLEAYKALPANHTASVGDGSSAQALSIAYDAAGSPHVFISGGLSAQRIDLLNAAGLLVRSYDLPASQSGSYDLSINALQLSNGVYFARLVSNGTSQIRKMLISK